MNNKKKSIEEVKEYFLSYGCKLLEQEYVNAHSKMSYICSCGKESVINFNNFRSGKRCGCGRVGLARLRDEEIKIETEARGYQFVSSEFIDSVHVVRCICQCGEERRCELRNLRIAKTGCRKCRDKKNSLDYEDVKRYFTEHGCELLDSQYKNARTKMRYRCSCGNEAEIVYDSFRNGNRCKKCGNKVISEKMAGDKHPNWNSDREQVESNLKFRKRCCGLVKSVLQSTGRVKDNRTAKLLGYDYKKLREHIQSHPNWLKVKQGEWHIDHIFPIKAFLDHGISDLKIINALDNLRPLSKQENLTKQAKYDKVKFEEWLKTKI